MIFLVCPKRARVERANRPSADAKPELPVAYAKVVKIVGIGASNLNVRSRPDPNVAYTQTYYVPSPGKS